MDLLPGDSQKLTHLSPGQFRCYVVSFLLLLAGPLGFSFCCLIKPALHLKPGSDPNICHCGGMFVVLFLCSFFFLFSNFFSYSSGARWCCSGSPLSTANPLPLPLPPTRCTEACLAVSSRPWTSSWLSANQPTAGLIGVSIFLFVWFAFCARWKCKFLQKKKNKRRNKRKQELGERKCS